MDVAIDDGELASPRWRAEPECSSHGLLVARGIIADSRPVLQTRIGLERIVDQHPLHQFRRTARPAARRRRRNASADSRSRTAACGRNRCAPACARASRSPAGASTGCKRQANMLADDLGRRPVDPGHLGAHAAPGLVGAPQQIRQPGEAGFDQHHAQRSGISGTRPRRGSSAVAIRTPPIARRSPRPDAPASPPPSAHGGRCCRRGCRWRGRASPRRRRSASRGGGRAACRPWRTAAPGRSGGPPPRRSISATARSGLCVGTRIEARSRGSRSSNSFATQSLTAEHSAIAMSSLNSATAPCSTLQMAKRRAERIERLAADHVEGAARRARGLPPVRARAERRVRRIARQVEGVSCDMAVDELVAPVFVEIGQQRLSRWAAPDADRNPPRL